MWDGVRRPRVSLALKHSGGAGAPPGTTRSPRQELARRSRTGRPGLKRGPLPYGRPRIEQALWMLRDAAMRSSSAKRDSAPKRARVARREAPAVSGNGHGHHRICACRRAAPSLHPEEGQRPVSKETGRLLQAPGASRVAAMRLRVRTRVIPAKAGIQHHGWLVDSGLRRNDEVRRRSSANCGMRCHLDSRFRGNERCG